MTMLMSDEDIKLSDSIREWFHFDENGDYVLREDAPEKVKMIYTMLSNKYHWIS